MPAIFVTPLSQVETTIKRHKPSHLMTLLSPGHMIETPEGIQPGRHLRLGLNDVSTTELAEDPPNEKHVDELIRFGRSWDAKAPMLIHCWAGISRSTAAAFVLACERNPHADEFEIARALRRASRSATPNRLIVSLADEMLSRGGRMADAVAAIGEGVYTYPGAPFDLPAVY